MTTTSFRIEGRPATFATAGEKPWKAEIERQAPRPDGTSPVRGGVRFRFELLTMAPNGNPLDVDNLCEPAFRVLVNSLGWLGGAGPNVEFIHATKQVGEVPGCDIEFLEAPHWPPPEGELLFVGVYPGPLPSSARSPELPQWLVRRLEEHQITRLPERATLELNFGSPRINLSDISTGVIKPTMDCLFPILGGVAGKPEDYRVDDLRVRRGVTGLAAGEVEIRLWARGYAAGTPPKALPLSGGKGAPQPGAVATAAPVGALGKAPSNPCREGTGKWIVCQAGIEGWSVDRVRQELERIRPGSSSKMRDYISDVRSENGIRVRIAGDYITIEA
jgi:hypothetical protein